MGLCDLSIPNISSVNLKLDLTSAETDSSCFIGREELHGVVVVKLLDCGTGRDRLLRLCNEHVLGCGRNSSALVCVEVDELSVNFIIRHSESTPRDAKLYVVILKRDERKRRLCVLAEREAKRVELSGVGTISVGGEGLGIRLREHRRCDLLREFRCMCIDNLTTYEKLNFLNLSLPRITCVISRGSV